MTINNTDILCLVLSVILGGLVGLEREWKRRPAGFHTLILICFGACLFTIISKGVVDSDHSRIAAQIVSGIGFLGAGVILQDKAKVLGLTTASTVWAIGAIGMALGFGKVLLAVIGTGIILLALGALHGLESIIRRKTHDSDMT